MVFLKNTEIYCPNISLFLIIMGIMEKNALRYLTNRDSDGIIYRGLLPNNKTEDIHNDQEANIL